MARLSLVLLGGLQARLPSGDPLALPTRKAQALLAYLALPVGQAHPRDKLAALLWGGVREDSARASLRQALFSIRKALATDGAPALVQEGDALALDPRYVEVDVATFEALVAEATPAALEQAATLYRGDLLAGLALDEAPFEQWLLSQRERLCELALEGLGKLLAHQRRIGAREAAVGTALKLLALDPLHEVVHRTLMRLHAELGRRGAALRQYQQCVATLQRELGTEPDAETKALYGEILRARSSRGSEPRAGSGTGDVQVARPQLVGRGAQVAELERALDDAISARGAVIAIVGEAGVGKTSLLATLDAAARARGARVLAGRCYESAQVLPFGPWAEALRGDRDALRVAGEALEPIWRAELARLVPEVAAPGLPVVGDDRLRLFEAIGRLMDLLAATRPLLVALEDVHWADEMSVRLLSFLARRARAAGVLVAVTVRDEEMVDAPLLRAALDELDAQGCLYRMSLTPLSREETGALVRALARVGAAESALERLAAQAWALSGGNPFVIVEAVRAVPEEREVGASSALPIPERVRRLIGGRLDRLGERERRLLAAAAVIGREFEFALVQRAIDLDEHEAARSVEELVRRRLLQVVDEQLEFAHDRIREVVARGLLPSTRKVLHAAVARAIEGLYPSALDAHAPALGLHYREAGAWDRAVGFLVRAALRAMSWSAYRDAAASYEQALAGLAQLPASRDNLKREVNVRLGLGSARYVLGDLEGSVRQVQHAERIAEELGDAARIGGTALWLALHAWIAGRPHVVQRHGERALAMADNIGDDALRAHALYFLGHGLFTAGDLPGAMARFRNVELLQDAPGGTRVPVHPSVPRGRHRAYLAWCLAESGQFADATRHGLEAVHDAEASNVAHAIVQAWAALANVHRVKGDDQRSLELFERAMAIGQAHEVALLFPLQQWFVGHGRARTGRIAEGAALIRAGLEQLEAWRLLRWVPLCVIHLGEVCLVAGRADEALGHAARALGLARELGQRLHEAYALRLLGEALAAEDAAGAELHYQQARALAVELGLRPLVAHCHLGLGALHRSCGKVEHAREHLGAAIALYTEMDMRSWLAKAEAEVG